MSAGLVALVADKDIEAAVRALHARLRADGHALPDLTTARHPQRDPGCRTTPEGLLRPFARAACHALVVFDFDGSGAPRDEGPEPVERRVEELLARNGWEGRAAAVVIDPEVERWVWTTDRSMRAALPAYRGQEPVRALASGFSFDSQGKPDPPGTSKDAFLTALRAARIPRSSDHFEKILLEAPLQRCTDRSLNRLLDTLRRWFPKP